MAKKKPSRKHPPSTTGISKGEYHRRKAVSEASKGNEWYKLRSKHGPDTLFATPQLLWEAACEYFKYVEDNPWKKAVLGKGGSWQEDEEGEQVAVPEVVEMNVKMPFTLTGLCLYIGCSESYFRVVRATRAKEDKDLLTVIENIQSVIYSQKFNGAAAGFFNAVIISRDIGLVDKTESKSEVLSVNVTPSAREAAAIRKALEKNI